MRFGIRDELVGCASKCCDQVSFRDDPPRPEVSGFFWVLSSIVQNELERGLDPVS